MRTYNILTSIPINLYIYDSYFRGKWKLYIYLPTMYRNVFTFHKRKSIVTVCENGIIFGLSITSETTISSHITDFILQSSKCIMYIHTYIMFTYLGGGYRRYNIRLKRLRNHRFSTILYTFEILSSYKIMLKNFYIIYTAVTCTSRRYNTYLYI